MKYLVHLHTTPSPGLAFYSGIVEVYAEDEYEAREIAINEVIRGAFREYNASMFTVTKVEAL